MFDAIGSGSGTIVRTTAKGAIDVVYVGDADADTFIMLEVGVGKIPPPPPPPLPPCNSMSILTARHNSAAGV